MGGACLSWEFRLLALVFGVFTLGFVSVGVWGYANPEKLFRYKHVSQLRSDPDLTEFGEFGERLTAVGFVIVGLLCAYVLSTMVGQC